PAENLRLLSIQHLNEIVNVEIYCHVRSILPSIGGSPSNMSYTMKLIYRGQADIAYPHFLRSDRPRVVIALCHELFELIVVLCVHHTGMRSAYKIGSMERCEFVHIDIVA